MIWSMRSVSVLLAIAVGAAACSSSSSGSSSSGATTPACASPIVGTYSLLRKVDTTSPNTCNLKDDTTPTTVTVGADGAVTFQNVSGQCHGSVQGCSLTATCGGTPSGGGTLTLQIGWIFDDTGFQGSTALTEEPTGKPQCQSTSVDTATRK